MRIFRPLSYLSCIPLLKLYTYQDLSRPTLGPTFPPPTGPQPQPAARTVSDGLDTVEMDDSQETWMVRRRRDRFRLKKLQEPGR